MRTILSSSLVEGLKKILFQYRLKYPAKKRSISFAAMQRIDSDIIFHYLPSKSKIISQRVLKEF